MRLMILVMVALLVLAPLAYAGDKMGPLRSPGPAPNSGDGIRDGSGFEVPPKGAK